jgi:hypothetical protein
MHYAAARRMFKSVLRACVQPQEANMSCCR